MNARRKLQPPQPVPTAPGAAVRYGGLILAPLAGAALGAGAGFFLCMANMADVGDGQVSGFVALGATVLGAVVGFGAALYGWLRFTSPDANDNPKSP
jgi:hypothetical protein